MSNIHSRQDVNLKNDFLDFGIRKEIHYPECWDTMAYPTLAHALYELWKCSAEAEQPDPDYVFKCTNPDCEVITL